MAELGRLVKEQRVSTRALPLDGITVVDITRVVAGPYCAQMLADLGAMVIKVEHPSDPDYVRSFPPRLHDAEGRDAGSGYFAQYNRHKLVSARVQLEPDRVRELLRYSLDPLSLDSPIGEEDESNLGDFIEDSSTDGPADAATRVMLTQAVGAVLGELSEREQEIVRLRFGLDGGQAKTLEEVGREFGVTRERIRQIEAKTLAKLRHPQRSQRLREFLEAE